MSDNGFRIVSVSGVSMILFGMFLAGTPLVLIVAQQAYHQALAVHTGGDYRGWMMAHLEGLLNGMIIIAIAAVTRTRKMSVGSERVFTPSLLISGWGNTIAAFIAPIFGVRGMIMDAHATNNLVDLIFTIALFATVTAIVIALMELCRKPSASDLTS